MNMHSVINDFSQEEIVENHKIFIERENLYKQHGLDQEETRRSVLRQLSSDHSSILEIGTGRGLLTAMLAGSFDKVVSVDVDNSANRIAKLNAAYFRNSDKIEFVTSDAGKLSYPDMSFDAVVSSFTFHHLEFPFKVIREMARLAVDQIVISDFNSRGFEIVEEVHKSEGNRHELMPGDFSIVGVYLKEFNFDVKVIEDKWQTTYSARRRKNS